MPFVKTDKQREAIDFLWKYKHALLEGGARSAKTTTIVRDIFMRASAVESTHLMVRYRYNHARGSLGHETVPKVIKMCFPDIGIRENKTESYWKVPVVNGEGESTVWLGGTDEGDRLDKLLGFEYSTVYANECSQIPHDGITLLSHRLAENSGLPLKFYYDLNPVGKRHWTYQMFHEGKLPGDQGPWKEYEKGHAGYFRLNPRDNAENLPDGYIEDTLEALPERQRKRFLLGLYLNDVEGACWTDEMLVWALAKGQDENRVGLRKNVVAVDPSTTNNPGSDECGIVVTGLDENREGVVQADLSKKCSTRVWAQRVVNAFNMFDCSEVVAEVNQGGDLVEDAIHNINPHIPVVKVRAAVGKFARAEPVSMLYEQKKVAHTREMPKLEQELTETVLTEVSASPNRLDALVWGLTHLMIKPQPNRIHIGVV